MSLETIRPFEISLWTLQDSFITVLKPAYGDFKGQIITPKLSLENNTMTLNFSIPIKYRNENGVLLDNPLWYSVIDGVLIANLRKIKVILNKGEEGEEVFEFMVHEIKESHKNGQQVYEVQSDWLIFEELGKIGYKLCLNYDEYLIDLEEKNKAVGEEFAEISLLPTLNYWADKIFKNTSWSYSIQMDWTSYDGIIDYDSNNNKVFDYMGASENEREALNLGREEKGLRRRDKVYEDEYVSSWQLDELTDKLKPREMISFLEKARLPEIEKSNLFNITQQLAELFGVFVRYKYYYDQNYHIIKKECIFYNTYLDEKDGKFDLNYGYQTDEIIRKIESADVITKLYVPTTEENSIVEVKANKSKEDYILNFDYLYGIKTITDEQYNSIPQYERKVYELNSSHKNNSERKAKLEVELNNLRAELSVLTNSIKYATQQIEQSDDLLRAITDNKGVLVKTILNPEMLMILPSETDGFKTTISLEGVYSGSIQLFSNFDSTLHVVDESSKIESFEIVYDTVTGKNVIGLKNISVSNSGRAYMACTYEPQLKYEIVKETFIERLNKDSARLLEVESEIAVAEEEISVLEELITEAEKALNLARADFERMMGPALREGSWEAQDKYLDYGDKYFIQNLHFPITDTSGLVRAIWDDELFDGEQDSYYDVGITEQPVYYRIFEITTKVYSILKDNLENLTLYYETPFENQAQPPEKHYLGYGSSYGYYFLRNDSTVKPYIMITEEIEFTETDSNFALGTTTINAEGELIFNALVSLEVETTNLQMVYPRIEINSLEVKTSQEELNLIQQSDKKKLIEYEDFSILTREDKTYLTIKSLTFLQGNLILNNELNLIANLFNLDFILSNANLHLYLDALEVSKTNAYPKVSYEVRVASLNKNFIKYSYQKLHRIGNINDSDLKLENVQGYISGIEMDLSQPWLDTFTIQNYKNKFEDLFSRIVASTQTMRQNQVSYDRAGGAFSSGGVLNGSILQNTLNNVNLNYSFNNGNLTIDELNGIWATSDVGVVAMRGGGIFCATQKDAYDNWIWNTGITPEGINASLLRAGTIDTNLIRIYSGENLRFQMNADGLFAYSQNNVGEANLDKYVVHNSEGIFLTQELINLVEISWDGLIIRNKDNEKVFYADDNGNLTITGKITAQTGNIGDWEISNKGLTYKDESNNITAALLPPSAVDLSTDNIFWAGENFSVSKDGTLQASNAIIGGTLVAGTVVQLSSGNEATLSSALKKMDVVSIGAGNTFKEYNNNYDGNITQEPNSLRFQLIQRNFSTTKEELSFSENGILIDLNNNENFTWVENNDNLVFVVKIDFMEESEEKTVLISCENGGENIQTSLMLSLEKKNVNKILSEIEPRYFDFNIEEGSEAIPQTFTVTKTGFGDDEYGQWYLNGVAIAGAISDSITVNSSDINSQAILSYVIDTVTRESLITKTVVPKNEITLVIESSNGTIFKNGNIETILTATLYQNGEIINEDEDSPYTYIWKQDGVVIEEENSRTLTINNGDFLNKSIFTCEVYELKE